MFLKDRQAILAKLHTTSADPVPTPEANAILASNIEFSVISRRLDRAHALPWMGKASGFNIGEGLKIKFNTEVRGKGAGVAPEVGCLLQACNFTETITPDTKVDYAPNSLVGNDDGAKMVAIYFYQDKLRHKILSARGTVSTQMKAGEYAVDTWEFTGIYAGAAHVSSMPAATLDETVPPRFVSALTTIGGFSPKFEGLSLDLSNNVVKRIDANSATGILEWMVTNRQPKGSIDPEVPELTQASLTTALTGDNNDLVFTAHLDYPGVDGNAITIEYEDTGTAGAETVTVTDTSIVVGIEASVSTATQVQTAIEASTAAMALLASVVNAAANNGSGAVIVMAETELAGGAGIDFWKRWEDSAGMAIVATVGQTAGSKCKFTCAKAVVDSGIGYADRENLLTHSLPFTLHPVAGNDEIVREYS